jgi:O-antigen/teichoic acid export membrane protein
MIFSTPRWLRTFFRALSRRVQRDGPLYERAPEGALPAFAVETVPPRPLSRGLSLPALLDTGSDRLARHGTPPEPTEVSDLGMAPSGYAPGERAPSPTVLYLGRLEHPGRIELLLDVIDGVPEATLEVADHSDHRQALEAELERRGLSGRVRIHGRVSDAMKLEMYRRAWVNVAASPTEATTVIEAAACGTPSAALACGALTDVIEDGHTGLLAETSPTLVEKTRMVVRDEALRKRLGRQALEWARELSGNREEQRSPQALYAERVSVERSPLLRALAGTDTGRAAGLAAAVLATNFIALVFTIVFARILGASGYGSLAALLSAFIILMVPGSALQIATAREVSQAVASGSSTAGSGVRRWLGRLGVATAVVAVVAIPLRPVIGALINVDYLWAAAAVPVTSMLWMLVSVERGVLQGFRRYKLVGLSLIGEAAARLAFGLVLVAAGLGVTGAFLASALALIGVGAALSIPLYRRLPSTSSDSRQRLRDLLAGSWAPVLGLTLLFTLQEVHVIVVKHEASGDAAGSYAVAAVAAKAIIWVAVGLGLYLLPEAARRAKTGVDARPILLRTLALIATTSVPMILIFTVAATPLLRVAFGEDLTGASAALPWLGLAMTLLSCTYLCVQYLLALGRARFIWILAVAAVTEVLLLAGIGADLTAVALALFGLQTVCAATFLRLSLRRAPARLVR